MPAGGSVTGTRAAGEQDRKPLERLLHAAFRDDPVSRWLFPGEAERETYHPRLFAAFLATGLSHGAVDMTLDGAGAAVWFSVRNGELAGGDEMDAALLRAVPENKRLGAMAELTEGRHPAGDHAYLQAIAVTAARRREGLGSVLLAPMLARCDKAGLGAYLEASSAGSRELYLRHGFTDLGRPVELPDGPPMWPMWRAPQS